MIDYRKGHKTAKEDGAMPDPQFIDIHALCQRYSLRPWTVRTWCSQRRIPFIRVAGKKVLFNVSEIETWLQQQTVTPSEHSQVGA
jgi:excisionase family DNA binding protein